ncbi:aspartate/glutamate racemase family protein [Paradesulfitobacterium ferrireducens]|uniref:aspartate/glutamate racemase family protein n=1 Tax=Paradesulfitobacterium ferrireducens TaxID=2816476 RepID=UPI001A8C3677|nr:aspartate/glutamate racemase family protein [Paradesulfitobacterium ferrireducens]
MKKQRIIGMFDSGVGGLTVMKEILDQIEDVRIVYVGDTARVPYGNRTLEELIRFGEEIITFLISQGAEIIVAACNTSSATALPVLKDRFDIPLIGMIEPGARLAVKHTKEGRIGLIATEATVRSKTYASAVSKALAKGVLPQEQRLSAAWKQGEQPIALAKAQACPLFVPLVEAGLANSAEARGIARTYLEPLVQAEVDTLILGCTHYPFLTPVLREVLGDGVVLVDPALAVVEEVRELLSRLEARDEAVPVPEPASSWRVRYFVSGDPGLFRQVGNTLLSEPIGEVHKVSWGE